MRKYAFILTLAMVILLAFTACGGNGNAITPPTEQDDNGYVETPTAQEHENEQSITTSAHVQLQLVDDESVRQWYMGDDLFDLSHVERYHEFDTGYDFARIVFTTNVTVRDFRFLNVVFNDSFSPGVDDRLYLVRDVMYTLEELTPEVPFVVTGADMGSALAANGFSFVDEMGQTRYFAFLIDGMSGFLVTMEFFDSHDEQQEQATPWQEVTSWQEGYAQILRLYAIGQNLREWEVGWRFILHDINQDGMPELFLVAESMTGHVEYRYVYTFVDGTLISLEHESFVTDGGVFAPIDDSPWVVFLYPAGSGGWYRKKGIEGNALSEMASGFFTLSEAGHEMFFVYGEVSGYEWYNLTINDEPVTANEFESIFGIWGQRRWLRSVPITEDNIRDGVFGWNPNTRLFNLMGVSGEWATVTSELISGLSINIPSDWQAYDYNHANDPFSSFVVYGEGIGSHIRIVIGESSIANPAQIVDGFQYSGQFHFNDGHIGYMLENEDEIIWLYIEEGILGAILSISLRHDGIRTIYTDNEELILHIVRSITLTP